MSGKSKVTLETINNNLQLLNDNFQLLIAKIGELDARVGKLETKVGELETKVGELEKKYDDQFSSVHAQLAALQKTSDNMARLVARIPGIEDRLTTLEADIASIKVRLDSLDGLCQHLVKKTDVLYDEYYSMRAALERLEKRLDRQDAERLAERVQLLERKVAALEKGAPN